MKDNFIFICHSSKDKKTARALYDYLQGRGLHCWIDQRSLQPGASYLEGIMEAIYASAMMIVIISKHTGESVYIPNEVERAFKLRKPILPVRTDDAELNKSLELALASTHYLDASGGRVEQYFDAVYEGCVRLMGVEREMSDGSSIKNRVDYWSKIKRIVYIITGVAVIITGFFLSYYRRNESPVSESESLYTIAKNSMHKAKEAIIMRIPRTSGQTSGSNMLSQEDKPGNGNENKVTGSTQDNITDSLMQILNGARYAISELSTDHITFAKTTNNQVHFSCQIGSIELAGNMSVAKNVLTVINTRGASGQLTIFDNGNRIEGCIIHRGDYETPLKIDLKRQSD
jgi:TIR domain